MSDEIHYTGYYVRQESGPEPGDPDLSFTELLDALDLVDATFEAAGL